MAIMLAAAAAALLVQPVCSWDRPGVNPYRGSPAAALAHYKDIPANTRALLAQRIAAGIPDDTVQIGRDRIDGHYQYDNRIGDMHFGNGQMCRAVTRTKWKTAHREPAAVYCVQDECVLVPKVCSNVSRIQRIVTSGGSGGGSGASGGSPPLAELPPFGSQPVPVYSTVPGGGDALPPWARTEAPVPRVPLPAYPGPGRETFFPVPVPVAPVPEPSTWAMLVAGVGLLAARLRRR